jgi:hypothetical protein
LSESYITVRVPTVGHLTVKTVNLVIRDDNGETIAQGTIALEELTHGGGTTAVMSPEMVTAVFGNPTMQHLYERYEDVAEVGDLASISLGEEPLDQSEIVDAKETGYSIFKDAIRKQGIVQGEDGEEDHTAEKRTTWQWCEEYEVDIVDPDGWRCVDAPAWDEPITLSDFYQRVCQSTARVGARTRLTRDATKSNA